MSEPSATSVLVSRAQYGDADAFEQLARSNAPMMYRVACQVVGHPEDAQDVVQRALLSAWQGLGSFRGDAALATWLHQITRRHALNCVTRRARVVPADSELQDRIVDPTADPADIASRHDQTFTVRSAVAALPKPERLVVQLFHFRQLSYAQIASATDSTEPAVRSRLFRARRSLATALAAQR